MGSFFRAPAACAILTVSLFSLACASDPLPRERPAPDAAAAESLPSVAAPEIRPRIVALGDSLTAGLGLPPEQAYPAQLQELINAAGLRYEVVNAGVSGDTSAGGRRRLDWSLEGDVRVLILALGANDGLRGLPVAELRRNLGAIIETAQARDITVVLAGMEAPPNFGRAYTAEFHQAYPDLAKQYGVALVPFLLEGVAGVSTLNQRDGIHPTAEGARRIADTVWTVLRSILD
jgi:acyl-CoA thioesterase-1